MTLRSFRAGLRGAAAVSMTLLLTALVGGCGDPQSSEPAPPGKASAPARTPDAPRLATPAPVALPPVAKLAGDYLPPRPVRAPERIDPAVEACIERNIHDKEYESMNPRDARRKLRRLQVKADCEQTLAAR